MLWEICQDSCWLHLLVVLETMLCSLGLLLFLFLLRPDRHITLAHQMLLGRGPKPSAIAVSNSSASSTTVHAHNSSSTSAFRIMDNNNSNTVADATTALPIPFIPNPEYAGDYKNVQNYQHIKSGTCAIEDDYCSFENNNGTVTKANPTNLDDRCLLWNSSCSGNTTLAMNRFFAEAFQSDLMSNACFAQLNSTDTVSVLNCDKYNSPARMSELQEIRNWMRSQRCVSAATEWAAINTGSSNFTFANAEDDITAGEDPDSQMAQKMDHVHYNYSAGVAPSCCGICDIYAENVDVYYWPVPDANTSCLSIIGENVRPLDYGATTTTIQDQGTPVTTITSTYWGCTAVDSYFLIASQRSVTDSYILTTAEISKIGSLTVKISSLSPWSSSPCNQDDTGSHLRIRP